MQDQAIVNRSQRAKRAAGAVAGFLLLTLAIGYAVRGVDLSVLRRASPGAFVALAGLVAANLLLTAGLFWSVTRSFGTTPPVGLKTMTALIAVSSVLNYIPVVRAGLWGRAAYLKKYHGLPMRQSVVILAVVLALALVVLGGGGLTLLLMPESSRWMIGGGLLIALSLATPAIASRMLRRPTVGSMGWIPLRAIDWIISAGRLWLSFAILAEPIGPGDALLIASASLLVKLTGLTPNGLGLSEWVIAALSATLMPIETATAAAAALIDRTMDVTVMIVAAAAGTWWLKRDTQRRMPSDATRSVD